MESQNVIVHLLLENRYEIGLIEQALRSPEYETLFLMETRETLDFGVNGNHVVMLEPTLSEWEWLDAAIAITRESPELPVILYSRDISVTDGFQRLSGERNIILTNDVLVLKERFGEVIGDLPEKESLARKRILFVDDETGILNAYSRMLRKGPWEVVTATSAEEALRELDAHAVDLVVTDMKMPEVHGIELIAKIRESFKELPILVSSAYHGMKEDQQLRFHGISGFLEKPIEKAVLETRIREVFSN